MVLVLFLCSFHELNSLRTMSLYLRLFIAKERIKAQWYSSLFPALCSPLATVKTLLCVNFSAMGFCYCVPVLLLLPFIHSSCCSTLLFSAWTFQPFFMLLNTAFPAHQFFCLLTLSNYCIACFCFACFCFENLQLSCDVCECLLRLTLFCCFAKTCCFYCVRGDINYMDLVLHMRVWFSH